MSPTRMADLAHEAAPVFRLLAERRVCWADKMQMLEAIKALVLDAVALDAEDLSRDLGNGGTGKEAPDA